MLVADFKAIQQLDLNLLKVFESLYLEQNMTRTAEALHITPSAVSHAMKRLRECLNDPLFQRSQNKMLPTPACQRMAPMIIDTLTRLRQILQQWGEFEPLLSRHHFRIGLHDALEASILPKLASILSVQAPNVTFASIKVERQNLTSGLASGHIDMAFDVALPIKPPVLHAKLVDEDFCVMLRRQHPWANKLDKQSYLQAKHISVSNRPSGAAAEDIFFQEQGMARKIAIRCQSYYAAKAMLINSDNLLTLPKTLAQQLTDENLIIRDVPLPIPVLSTHLYWHQNTLDDAALSWFRKVLSGLELGSSVNTLDN
jgi:DNA-binding transcriptional LysR family regulator